MFEKLNGLKHLPPQEFDAALGEILEAAAPKAPKPVKKVEPVKKAEPAPKAALVKKDSE